MPGDLVQGRAQRDRCIRPSGGSSKLVQEQKKKLKKENDPKLNPARTWRKGEAAEVFNLKDLKDLYPGGIVGQQDEPRSSKRVKKDERQIFIGRAVPE